MKDKQAVSIDMKKKALSFLILIFPIVLVAIIPDEFAGSILKPLLIKVLIVLYQGVVLLNFLDNYYGE